MTCDLRLVRESEVDDVNPVAGDLFIEGVDFAIVRDADAVVQEIEFELRWWLGEWFLDRRRGVPYVQQILKKGVSLELVQTVLGRAIRRVPSVRRIERWGLTLDSSTRRLAGAVEIRIDDGTPSGVLRTAEVG